MYDGVVSSGDQPTNQSTNLSNKSANQSNRSINQCNQINQQCNKPFKSRTLSNQSNNRRVSCVPCPTCLRPWACFNQPIKSLNQSSPPITSLNQSNRERVSCVLLAYLSSAIGLVSSPVPAVNVSRICPRSRHASRTTSAHSIIQIIQTTIINP